MLRYDKRTLRPPDYAAGDYGVDDEVTSTHRVSRRCAAPASTRRVAVGHSLGAMMAPHRGAPTPPARSCSRRLPPAARHLVEQFARGRQTAGVESTQGLDGLQDGIARIRAGEDVPASQAPLGQSTAYWRSIETVDPVADARSLAMPLLILHGNRDIQVTDDDWQGWQRAFTGNPRATLKAYPALSHLGIAGSGPGSLADYQTAGHVDAALIRDIAEWLLSH